MPPEIVLGEYHWRFFLWPFSLLLLFAALAKLLAYWIFGSQPQGESTPGLKYWFRDNVTIFFLFGFLSVAAGVDLIIGQPWSFFQVAWALVGGWLLVALLVSYSRERVMVRLLALVAYIAVALHSLGWLDTSITFLKSRTLSISDSHISLYGIVQGLLILVFMLWLAQLLSGMLEKRIQTTQGISSSIKVLLGKAIKIALITIALLVAVDSMGLDLTVLTVFGGGIGLGLGFGLQKVVSNLFSGFILLTDRSIKPGDVIEIENTYGWINNLRARYVSIITRDGTEHLIPNEDLITQRVINWSFTDNLLRIKVSVGVSYKTDLHKAMALTIEAAKLVERVLENPPPLCHLIGFGDSSVDLEVRIWINDPINGVTNVKGKVLLKIWDLFKENGIEIPFPQRDLHLKPPAQLDVNLLQPKDSPK